MGNSCQGESKYHANGNERSVGKNGRRHLQTESTPQQLVVRKKHKKISKEELIARLEKAEIERKSEQEKYNRWASDANSHYKEELEKARQQIRQAENNLEVKNKNHEQRERQNQEKHMKEIQGARKETEQTEKKLADATKKAELDRQMFLDEISKLQKENKQLQEEKESLLSRFSAIAAAKLTDGNANIADLSDENRPTKISEMYSELYDNEWTDAFVFLTKDEKRSERDACLILARAFCNAYDVCKVKAKEDMERVTEALTVFYENRTLGNITSYLIKRRMQTRDINKLLPIKQCKKLPPETLKQMKDQRKRLFDNHIHTLMKKYKDQIGDILQDEADRNSEVVGTFLKKCVQICWLMAIQDPQVFVDTNLKNIGKRFDTERYKPYTKSGSYIGFIVWPTLYLHEDGGILMKGIAQGTSDKPQPDYENVERFHNQKPDGEIKKLPHTLQDHANKNDEMNASSIQQKVERESLKVKENLADANDSGRKSEVNARVKFGDWQKNNTKDLKKTIVSVKN